MLLMQVVRADPGALHILCDLLLPHITRLVEPSPQQLPPLKMHLCATVQLVGQWCRNALHMAHVL
jgi:hypothetical protein